jgi:thiol-disulfide isomerase/thioredoxin
MAIGKAAPDFNAINLATGQTASYLKNYRGSVTLVNVWATWCGPCRQEIPSLQALYQTLGPKGLKIAAVSVDTIASDSVTAFMKQFGVTFDVLHDRERNIQTTYGSEKFPESFLIDKQGNVVRIDYGARVWTTAEMLALVNNLLAQPAS